MFLFKSSSGPGESGSYCSSPCTDHGQDVGPADAAVAQLIRACCRPTQLRMFGMVVDASRKYNNGYEEKHNWRGRKEDQRDCNEPTPTKVKMVVANLFRHTTNTCIEKSLPIGSFCYSTVLCKRHTSQATTWCVYRGNFYWGVQYVGTKCLLSARQNTNRFTQWLKYMGTWQ